MADSNKSGNAWGWFGLIVVVALIGAGYLYQREGGKIFGPTAPSEKQLPQPSAQNGDVPVAVTEPRPKPSVPASAEKPQESQTQPPRQHALGKMVVSFSVSPDGNHPMGPWLYIRKKIYKDFTSPTVAVTGKSDETFSLEPGNHLVELGYLTRWAPDSFPFPLGFQSKEIKIEPDKTCQVAFEIPGSNLIPHGKKAYEGLGIVLPPLLPDDNGKFLKGLIDRLNSRIHGYTDDKVRGALVKAYDQRRRDSPKRPLIFVPLPETAGGGRELDAQQVDLIVEWLKFFYAPPLLGDVMDSKDFPQQAQYFREVKNWRLQFDRNREIMEQLKVISGELRKTR
jgi:hypothetical protein